MTHRYYLPSQLAGDAATLTGPEAHHLVKVMRASVGDEITLFDGRGNELAARITAVSRSEVLLAILSQRQVNRELPFSLALGVALPKGERQRWLVEKLVELGATRLTPLTTQRGVAQPTSSALERLQRAVIEACKQCGRNRLMQIDDPRSLGEFAAGEAPSTLRLIAQPGGAALEGRWQRGRDVVAAIGPEGGFTDEEVATAYAAGWEAVGLGERVLRVETAAIAMAAFCSLRGLENHGE